ncbi:MAG TPA: glycoside hydrolase family 5 protein [bacterium]|nr:glycoside hydrolase family 5 protein [bacterium]
MQWIFCLAAAVLLTGCAGSEKPAFTVRRGTNISHWLSQSDRRGEAREAWFTEQDVAFLAGLGLDHLRIPVDEEQLWDEAGEKEPEAFRLLHAGLEWCARHNLRAIVDLHILRSHHFNEPVIRLWTDPAAQDRFVRLWRDLSEELRGYPVDRVAYELMNEAVADDPEDWNRLAARAYAAIRENEPERVIVIGSNRWQIVHTFDALKVPENDPHLLLSFHFYTPMPLTHYKAPWWRDGGEYAGPVRYPGRIVKEDDLAPYPENVRDAIRGDNGFYTRDSLEALLEKPLRKRAETGLPLYCGEWGCLPTVPETDRLAWYQDMVTILEKHGIGWATWDYKGDFGLIDREGRPVEELIAVLLDL